MSHRGTPRRAPPAGSGTPSRAAPSTSAFAVDDLRHHEFMPINARSAQPARGVVQRLPHVIAGVGELLGAAHDAEIAARTRQRHLQDLLDAALTHDHDAVGDQHRFVEIMGDEQDGLAGAGMDLQQLLLHGLAGLGVERPERLVHQQDLGIDGERAGDADALLHAAGQLMRAAILRRAVGRRDRDIAARCHAAQRRACPSSRARTSRSAWR